MDICRCYKNASVDFSSLIYISHGALFGPSDPSSLSSPNLTPHPSLVSLPSHLPKSGLSASLPTVSLLQSLIAGGVPSRLASHRRQAVSLLLRCLIADVKL
ncbi:hypothetical protein COCNU_scaffold015600G000010 [Cocos nucifera]|nr:hypothetical protein [Cocos nucifera]